HLSGSWGHLTKKSNYKKGLLRSTSQQAQSKIFFQTYA
ncbi:MAG: hypothetical protein ACI9PU_002697, partial [Ascidiaceihabitans sp.]